MCRSDRAPTARPTVAGMRRTAPTRCEWCGRELPVQEGLGRRRRYCAHACRQRAYENRNAANRGDLPADAVVLTATEASDLADRLYQMRCAAEDVATAVSERVTGRDEAEVVQKVMLAESAIKELVEPADVASLVAWLVSDDARMVTGASYTMDGGWSAR